MLGRTNTLFLFAAAFIILAPLSVAGGSSLDNIAKYLRLATTVGIVLFGVMSYQCFRFRKAGKALVAFTCYFVLSSCWSDLPHWALFYKGMFGITVLSGLALAYSVRDTRQLWHGLRMLGLVAGFAGASTFVMYLRNPLGSTQGERLTMLGMNANMLGMTAAALMILCAFLAFYEKSRRWKVFAYAACGLLGLVVVGSASRGSLLMAGVGCLLVGLPVVKRPAAAIGIALTVIVFGMVVVEVMPMPGLERLDKDLTKNTRQGIWKYAQKKFLQAPIMGHGWLHYGNSWAAVQSTYLQLAAETGLVGLGVLGWFLLVLGNRTRYMSRRLRRFGASHKMAYLAVALTGSVLVHSVAESATLMGSTLNALLLGLGVGLTDRVPEFVSHEAHEEWLMRLRWSSYRTLVERLPSEQLPL